MARQRIGARVLGPNEDRSGWRVIAIRADGSRATRILESEAEAQRIVGELRRSLAAEADLTVQQAIDKYELYLRRKGNKERSIDTTLARLDAFFSDTGGPLRSVTAAVARKRYDELALEQAVDTHRNTLAEARTFFGWCVRERKISRNPLEGVVGVGKRRRGKAQLRIDEARSWLTTASTAAAGGKAGAVAAMVTLLMGLRADEVVGRQVRDLDDDGRLLWIPEAKTEAGRRTVEVPELLRAHLVALAAGKLPTAKLFGDHWRDWPRKWVQRLCRAAGVPEVTAHGMRGLHATLAEERGVTAHAVAQALGHESSSTTHAHYTSMSTVDAAMQRRTLEVLRGGKGG